MRASRSLLHVFTIPLHKSSTLVAPLIRIARRGRPSRPVVRSSMRMVDTKLVRQATYIRTSVRVEHLPRPVRHGDLWRPQRSSVMEILRRWAYSRIPCLNVAWWVRGQISRPVGQ